MYWISTYDSFNSGYNMTEGGGGIRGFKQSDEQKEKVRIANTGRIVTEEAKRHMRENHADFKGINHPTYGVPWSQHITEDGQRRMREKMSLRMRGKNNPNYGKKMSDEQKKKISESHKEYYRKHGNPLKGRKRPDKSGVNSPNARPVVCLTTGETYPYIEFAASVCGVSQSSISTCCAGKMRFAGHSDSGDELFWMYLDEYNLLSDEEKAKQYELKSSVKPNVAHKSVRCINTGEIFYTMKEACEKYHIDQSSLSAHCRKRRLPNGCGRDPETNELLKWEYVD